MKRIAFALVALSLLTLAPAGSAQQASPDAPTFKHPRAVQAHRRYQFRQQQAWQAFQKEMAEARTEYVATLHEAAALAARGGYAEELKAISDEQSRMRDPFDSDESRWRTLNGLGHTMEVQLHRNGRVTPTTNRDGVRQSWSTWRRDGANLIIGDMKFEPVTVYYRRDNPLYIAPFD